MVLKCTNTSPFFGNNAVIRLGTTIKKLRVEKGISQKQLAATADLTPSFVSLIENDHREPSISAISRLATALDLPAEVLIWDAVVLPSNLGEEDRRLCEIAKLIVRRFYENPRDDTTQQEPLRATRRHTERTRKSS